MPDGQVVQGLDLGAVRIADGSTVLKSRENPTSAEYDLDGSQALHARWSWSLSRPAMAEIWIVPSRLTPAAFWHAVDLFSRAPSGSPMSMTAKLRATTA